MDDDAYVEKIIHKKEYKYYLVRVYVSTYVLQCSKSQFSVLRTYVRMYI